jgi:phospholipid/cholesterol/gamma-HCH transport system permease protein
MLMMPLLCIYADFVGILGGMLVGVGAFDISATQYLNQTRNALSVTHFGIGVAKSVVFGLIVAICGCMQGMRCGRSAAAVGQATTAAVVIAIVYIVVADGLFAVLTNVLGI